MLSDVARITSGTLVASDTEVVGVTIDSRSVTEGALFVPIVADRDGHDFIASAVEAGASAFISSRPASVEVAPAVTVADTAVALRALGSAARESITGEVVGITGSVGKTTAKDLLAAALSQSRHTHASLRSFNNELGVPLTLLNAPENAQVVIVEMGARGQHHIQHLCAIARPTVGIVLTVGGAHTALFGDIEGVARAKRELVEALPADGAAVLNADDRRVSAMSAATDASVVTFGDAGDVRATAVRLDALLRPRFTLESPWGGIEIELSSAGWHSVTNALAASAAALVIGADLESVAVGLAQAQVSPWRMEVGRHVGGGLIINDAYNANPMSMHAAIDTFLGVSAARRVAVIGEMAELGDESETEHIAVGERLEKAGVEVLSVGVEAYGGRLVPTASEALAALGTLSSDTAILVKGSRVAGLEAVAAGLTAR